MTTRTTYCLARLADCAAPNAQDSPGADFLRSVEGSAIEHYRWAKQYDETFHAYKISEWSDMAHEIADAAVPIYTHQRWQVFVDVAGYQEDVSEYGEITDLTVAAGAALYIIAQRLALAIAIEMSEEEEKVT